MLGTVSGLTFLQRWEQRKGGKGESESAAAAEVSLELDPKDLLPASDEDHSLFLPDLELSFDLDVEDLREEERSASNDLLKWDADLELSFSLDADEDLSEQEQEWIWDIKLDFSEKYNSNYKTFHRE